MRSLWCAAATLVVASIVPVSGVAATEAIGAGGTPGAVAPDERPAPPVDASAHARSRLLIERAVRYENGEGVARDPAMALQLYCAAARSGDPDGFLRLGWMYANGRGVARDDSTASTLFRRAADLGSDLGARLAVAIRGTEHREPDCLHPPPATASEPATAPAVTERAPVRDAGPTPVVDAPARFRPAPTAPEHRKLVATVLEMSKAFRLDPRLVFALIRVESGFDPLARSPKNAQGLMQLIPETAERFGVRDVWDPVENLRGGMSYLRWLLSYFKGDIVLTLAAYNAGEGAVDRHRGVPPYSETIAYVQRIRALYPFDRHGFDPRVAASSPPTGPRRAATDRMPADRMHADRPPAERAAAAPRAMTPVVGLVRRGEGTGG